MKEFFDIETGFEPEFIKSSFHSLTGLVIVFAAILILFSLVSGAVIQAIVLFALSAISLLILKLIFHTIYQVIMLTQDKLHMQKQIDWLIDQVYEGEEEEKEEENEINE